MKAVDNGSPKYKNKRKENREKMKPLVSVIMPAYNGEKYIQEAIDSVLEQTYENWELIIIEDASADHSMEIIKRYQDKRIRLFCNEQNKGIAESTNRGIQESRGKYIALLDDDDIAEKDRFTLQVNYLETHSEIDILGGRTTVIDTSGKVIDYSGIPRNNPKYIKAVLLFCCMDFWNSTAMIRREFIEKFHLYYENGYYGIQDFKFYMESSKVGNISTIPQFLLKHRLHSGNETDRNLRLFQKERERMYAKIQCDSLEKSGFSVKKNDMTFLNKVLAEQNGKCDSIQELRQLYWIFCELLQQGRKMEIDYLNELEHVCKVKMAEQLIRMKHFFEREEYK